jgi:hypothetical protein
MITPKTLTAREPKDAIITTLRQWEIKNVHGGNRLRLFTDNFTNGHNHENKRRI